MLAFEAWIEKGMTTRTVFIQAAGFRAAYAQAREACGEGETLRGVIAL